MKSLNIDYEFTHRHRYGDGVPEENAFIESWHSIFQSEAVDRFEFALFQKAAPNIEQHRYWYQLQCLLYTLKTSRRILRHIRPDAIVCLNGMLPKRDDFFLVRGVPVIAADGAANSLHNIGITPDFIVGDLDSISDRSDIWQSLYTAITYIGDQNTNDFEKSLVFALEHGWANVLVVGMQGGDLDHTLNNWSIVIRYGRRMNLCIFDTGRISIPVYEAVEFETQIGDMVSLIPQPKAELTTRGLQWELNGEVLELGVREGARNRTVTKHVEIDLFEGTILLVIKAGISSMMGCHFALCKDRGTR